MVFVIIHTPRPTSKGFRSFLFACLCLLASMLYACASLFCFRLCHVWYPPWAWPCVVTSDAYEVLFGCNHLGGIFECWVAPCVPFPFPLRAMLCLPCLFVPTINFLCIFTRLLTCPCMSLACSCVIRTSTQWSYGHLIQTYICPPQTPPFVCFPVCLPSCLLSHFFACHVYHAYLLFASFICSTHLFLSIACLLVFCSYLWMCTNGVRTHRLL